MPGRRFLILPFPSSGFQLRREEPRGVESSLPKAKITSEGSRYQVRKVVGLL